MTTKNRLSRVAVAAAITLLLGGIVLARPGDGNRLTYLDGSDPYYVSRTFPKLITPQWVGEEGVEAVVVLAIDDMRDPAKYEAYLRPILDRLKRIDGRAPVSIMTNTVPDVNHPLLAAWLQEGLNLDVHTIDHPCPLLAGGDFAKARSTYDRCVDLLAGVPGNRPVAFRMPCCDSLNTPSPRFFAEIFNKTTPGRRFLTIDTSVFNITTPDDPALPRELVFDPDGRERFRKYVPFDSFVNTIFDYPYPYVIGNLCWQFPCATPSDWQAQHLHKPDNPKTVQDWKALLDATVIKQGVMNLVFHPHNWIKPQQVVELIDHAVSKHGKKVKFLNFRECQERLDRNLLSGSPLRDEKGNDNGVRLLDVNTDGYMDVVVDNPRARLTRVWRPQDRRWSDGGPETVPARVDNIDVAKNLPEGVMLVDARGRDNGVRFVDLNEDGFDDLVFSNDDAWGVYLSTPNGSDRWRKVMAGKAGEAAAIPQIVRTGTNNGAWFHSRHLWVQNEHTAKLPNLVDRRSFADLTKGVVPDAKSPEAALKSIQVKPGFAVELMASEPLLTDPVNFDWGPDGKFWVVEMTDYPTGIDGKGAPGGRVQLLTDIDGDGKYDKATTFLDKLPYPDGVMAWRKGVLVAAAPDILYAEDTDGDGKADKREVLYTGFTAGNPQHNVNGFVRGLDNWIYGANGHSGGRVTSTKTGKVHDLGGRDFRIRPDTGEFDALSGTTQFGRTRDDWGNWFGCDNSNPIFHFVLDDAYLRRNPHVAPPHPWHGLSQAQLPIFPASTTVERFNDFGHVNRITSSNGVHVYRDELFGPRFANTWFVSEPVHNLIHRQVMTPSGFTFASARAAGEEKSEFLASTDNWFRPTTIRTGPDGALWFADMYRQVIEHPEWIPMEWQRKFDVRAGADKGRIYRVYPVGAEPRAVPRLSELSTAARVAALESPNGWVRDMAQELLVQANDRSAVAALENLALGGERAQTRLHALCTLDGMNALAERLVLKALHDSHPGVRRHAVRLCEGGKPQAEEFTRALEKLIDDPDAQVRLQLAFTLGEFSGKWGGLLGKLALKDPDDLYFTAAVLSSVTDANLSPMLRSLMGTGKAPPPNLLEKLLDVALASSNADATATLLGAVTRSEGGTYQTWQLAALAALLDTLERRESSLEALAQGKGPDRVARAVKQTAGLFAAARRLAAQEDAPLDQRATALRLVGRQASRRDDDLRFLQALLAPQVPEALQAAAVGALGRVKGLESERIPQLLLAGWKGYGPDLRARALDALLRRTQGVGALLDAVEARRVLPAEIDAERRQRLLQRADARTRERANALLADVVNPDRQNVLESFAPATSLEGEAARGQPTFVRICATCHQLSGAGNPVGPDLAALSDKSPESLLMHIVDPNRAVEAKYTNYVIETRAGDTLSGILAGETGNSVTLVSGDGKSHVVLRADVRSLRSTGTSLMPEGLETGLTHQNMADLLAYVRSSAPVQQRKTFAGNKPDIIRPGPDGSLRLLATNAEIYGKTLVLEDKHSNLGFWSSEDDRAVWVVEPARPGRYAVWLEWACDDTVANNRFVVRTGEQRQMRSVPATGGWDTYKKQRFAEITLRLGRQRVIVHSEGPVAGALMDLKSIELIPTSRE